METHRSHFAIALALVALVSPTAFSAPATRSTCAPASCQTNARSQLNYQTGKTYVYNFETEVTTQVLGSTDESSKIKLKGQALIAASSPCDFTLTVQQVAIQNPSGQAISRVDDIEGSSLRFTYQDGAIENVCTSEDDPTWSANVKRAIISMITNKAQFDQSTETIESDIAGNCPTHYEISGSTYVKTRDLNACSDRDGGYIVSLGVPYTTRSRYNSAAVLDSSLTCTQELQNGVFQSVSCVESHKVPFLSTSSSGIQTEIRSSLNLANVQNGVQRGSKAAIKPSSVFYDHSPVSDAQTQRAVSSRAGEQLARICQEVADGAVSAKVPSLYLGLVKSLKSLKASDIRSLYNSIKSGSLCPGSGAEKLQKLLVDAAATSGSDGAIGFLSDLIVADEVGCHTKSLLKAFASFAQRPDKDALLGMARLLASDKGDDFLLVASAVGHQYCRMTNPDCGSVAEYRAVVDKIAARVRKVNDDVDEDGFRKVAMALQALGNLDHLTSSAISAISSLIDDQGVSSRLKVRALDAFRRDPCQPQLRNKALSIFRNRKESTHLRIQAYLTLSKCFSQQDVDIVQTVLNGEESNHVASFVASHIESTQRSASPSKQALNAIFSQFTIPEGLRRDIRKFSRTAEFSTFVDNYNLGGALDANIIFSQDSYLPRMASANLTLDAFGRSYNLLELGLYAEEFEHYVEKFFGPVGLASGKSLEKLVTKGTAKLKELVQDVRSRFRRNVKTDVAPSELEAVKGRVRLDEERVGDRGEGDLYIRVMGTSVLVESFNLARPRDYSQLAQNIGTGFQRIVESKDHKFDLTHPVTLIDEELILPTFSGLPLNLELEGNVILSMQMSGKADLGAIVRGENADVRAKFIPSAASVLKSRMTVGTGPIESGLQLEGKVHSSTGVDIKMVKEEGKLEMRFNLPQEKTQIIDIRSDVYWVEQGQEGMEKKTSIQSKVPSRSVVDKQCLSTLSKPLGLKLCANFQVPSATLRAPFPMLNGPGAISLSIEKSEPSMEGYYVKLERTSAKSDRDNLELELLVDTPGSRVNRKIEAHLKALQYRSLTPHWNLKVDSPWSKFDVDYKRSFTEALKGVELKINRDGNDKLFDGKIQLKRSGSGSSKKYEPVLEYSFGGRPTVRLVEGEVVVHESQRKAEVDLKTAGNIRLLRVGVKGTLEAPPRDDGFELRAKDVELYSEVLGKLILDGHLAREGRLLDGKLKTRYGSESQHSFEVAGKIGQRSTGRYEFLTKVRSSRLALFNFDINAHAEKQGHNYKSELTYTRGTQEPRVELKHKLDMTFDSVMQFEIHEEATLKHPTLELDAFGKFDAKFSPREGRKADVILNVNSFKSSVNYESTGQGFLEYRAQAKAEFGGKTYEASEVATKISNHKHNVKTRFAVSPGGFWINFDTDLTSKQERSDQEYLLVSTITSDRFEGPAVFRTGMRGKPEGYNTILKLDVAGRNRFDVLTTLKLAKGTKPAKFEAKATVADYLESALSQTFSLQQADTKVDIKWLPTGRKIAGVSKVGLKRESLQIDADLKWDADRNPTQSVAVKGETKFSTSTYTFESQHDITVTGSTVKLKVNGQGMKEFLNGENKLFVDFTSPSGRQYVLDTSLDLENRVRTKAGKAVVKLTLPEESPYQWTWDNRITNIDSHELTFEASSNMRFDFKGQKDFSLRGEVKSTLPGNYRSFSGKLGVTGSAVREPLSAEAKADFRKGKLGLKGEASRGTTKSDAEVNVDYDIWAAKKTLAVTYTLNTPFDYFRTVEGTVKLGALVNSLTNFELTDEGSFTLNHGSPAQWKGVVSLMDREFKALSEFTHEGRLAYSTLATVKCLPDRKVVSNFEVTAGSDKAFLKIDLNHNLPAAAGLEIKGGAGARNFEFKTTHERVIDGVYETDILAKRSTTDLVFRVTNKLEWHALKKSVDLLLAAKDEPTRRVFLSFDDKQNNRYEVETLIRWGDGNEFFSTKGDLQRVAEGFEATLDVEGPSFRANKMNIKVTKKSQGGRDALALKVQEGNKDRLTAVVDYGSTTERSGAVKAHEGSINIKSDKSMFNLDFSGKFRLEDGWLQRQRDGEEGRQLRGSFEMGRSETSTPVKGSALLKTSDKEKRAQFSVCNDAQGRCRSGDVHFRHEHKDNGDMEYSLRVVGEREAEGQKSALGVNIRTTSTENGRQLDHTVMLILNRNSEKVGYRLYRKDGHELGAEILLPERTMAAVLDVRHPAITDLNLDLSFFFDKIREPGRKISFIFNTEKSRQSSGLGRKIEFIFRHPDFDKDLKVRTTYSIAEDSSKLLEVTTVLDLFKANNEILVSYRVNKEAVSEGHKVKTQWSVVSAGQGIDFGGRSDISYYNHQFHYKHELHYQNRERQMKTATIDARLAPGLMSFEVLDGTGRQVVSLVSKFEEHSHGFEYKQYVLLPGMEDTRIFEAILHTHKPRRVVVKTFTSTSPPGVYYEGILGFKSEDKFVAGLYDSEGSNNKKVLADFTVALNHSRILFIKTNWERQNIQQVWNKATQRLRSNGQNLRALVTSTIGEVVQEVGHTASKLNRAVPNVRPAFTSAQTRFNDLMVELDAHEDTKMLLDGFLAVQRQVKTYVMEAMKAVTRVFVVYVGALRNALQQMPQALRDGLQKLPITREQFNEIVENVMLTVMDLVRRGMLAWKQLSEKISNSMPDILNFVNRIIDLTSGFTDFLQGMIELGLEYTSKIWRSVRHIFKDIIDSEFVRTSIRDVVNLAHLILKEFIEESKVLAETLKDYLLDILPEGELQDLVQLTADYVEKKAKNEPVDDLAAVKAIYDKIVAIVKKAFNRAVSFYSDEGLMVAKIPLPVEIHRLSDLTHIFSKVSIPAPPSIKYNLPAYRLGIAETFNKIRHGAGLSDLLPPYDGYGIIMGSQHYRTFDGQIFRFDGTSCGYVLATDVEDGNFTIVVDYESNSDGIVKKSIIVKSEEDETLAIVEDGVVVNGRKYPDHTIDQERPGTENFKVEKRDGDWVVILGDKGFAIGCSRVYDVCVVKVNGYYHGKVMGLLGKFSHETFDDFTTPEGYIVDNVNEFAQSWKLSPSCRNRPVVTLPFIRPEAQAACADAFTDRSSNLRPCFGVVDPKDYQRVCETLSSDPQYDVNKAVCTVSTAYSKACKLSFAKVDVLQGC